MSFPVEVCLDGVASRKGKKRTDMPWVEKEEDEEVIKSISFIKNYKEASRPGYRRITAEIR